MTISIVIATYNRASFLGECLASLANLAFEPGDEVIVVDNGSTDATPRVIARAGGWMPVPLRHLVETRPGKSHALQQAIGVAGGDVLAFTDDDVLVDPAWLTSIREAMSDPAIALTGGPVTPRWERMPPRWLGAAVEGYGRLLAPLALLDYGPSPADLGPRTFLGANMAVRRDVLERLGGFAVHLGKLRGTLLSGEDHDLCLRVQAAGFRARYAPGMRVRHWVPASRMRLGYFLNWFFWSGITNAVLDDAQPRRGRSLLGVPLYLFRRAAAAGPRGLAFAAIGNLEAAVEHAIDIAFVTGYAVRRWTGRRMIRT
jgi:GT2 family glycosyltransferase